MKEILKRELNKTYLILSSEAGQYEETYETEMIIKNEPTTILPLHILRVDGTIQLFYDVSSKQTLKSYTERVKLSAKTIRELFRTIRELEREVTDYLLELESVVLDLEHIYTKDEKFYFCYCPWEKQEVIQGFRGLLEEILGNLDYHDTEGVELAYHLYQSACKGIFCIEEILKEHCPQEERSFEKEDGYAQPYQPEETIVTEYEIPISEKKEVSKEKTGIFKRLFKFFLKKEEKLEEKTDDSSSRTQLSEEFFFDNSRGMGYTEVFTPTESNTVLLGELPMGQWKLRPLLAGYEEFSISGESFIVGKQQGAVDGVIIRDTISRIHSRLFVKNEKLFIADANSTNGTYVNGTAINPGEMVEIFAGDRILFADVGYECYNSL